MAGAPCPCVPDRIKFRYDFTWGCDHPPSSSDFASTSSCRVSAKASNSKIKMVVIQDLENEQEVELFVEEVQQAVDKDEEENKLASSDSEASSGKIYTFDYHRSWNSPTVLWIDFYTTSSGAGTPVASIDLNYSPRSIDCINPYNPVFWAGDMIYFLDVVRKDQ